MKNDAPIKAQHGEARCTSATSNGQCPNRPVEGGKNCILHGGNKQLKAIEQEKLRNYRLGKWQARINELSDSDRIKDLSEDIAILRMTLENIISQCETDTDLLMMQPRIQGMVQAIEKTVTSTTKLEISLKEMLDKQSLINLAMRIQSIISQHIQDPDTLEAIAQDIEEALTTVTED